jgi:hypothetical protein
VGLAEIDDAGRHQLAHQRSGLQRAPLAPGGGATHGRLAFDFYAVFDCDGHTVERTDGKARSDGMLLSK